MKTLIIGILIGGILGGGAGIGIGIYLLPVIVEYQNRDKEPVEVAAATEGDLVGMFDRDSPGSDALHWGEGDLRVTEGKLIFEENVELAPGPDYRVYLTTKFADTKEDFLQLKDKAIEVGRVKQFSGPLSFTLPDDVEPNVLDNVTVWCEAFGMYIASSRLE